MNKMPNSLPNQSYINHIFMAIDASASMRGVTKEVVKVVDNQIKYLAQRSTELDQETRVTVYVFNDSVTCLFYDKDVLRLPSLSSLYNPSGMTALIDATVKAIYDLSKTPELYGDHAFLGYVITDGQENRSKHKSTELSSALSHLADNWTLAVFVPNQNGVYEAKKFGFPANNISVWDASSAKGVSEAGERMRTTTDAFMTARTSGIRGSRNLFQIDTSNLTPSVIKGNLMELHPGQYRIFPVSGFSTQKIAPFVEANTGVGYRLGSAFYELSKPETVQANKTVAVLDTKSRKLYTGSNARGLIGLPDHETRVSPADHPQYKIFVQSTSVNRNLIPGTELLLLS